MQLVLRFFILFTFFNTLGQDWHLLNQKSILSYQQGNYNQAIIAADSALLIAKEKNGKVNYKYLSSLSNRAYAEAGLGETLMPWPISKQSLSLALNYILYLMCAK